MAKATAALGEATSPYLPPAAALGCPYCFDPDSPLLRTALQPHPRPDPLPTEPFLTDLAFLHQLLRRQYAGYPDWLQQQGGDPGAFFTWWMETVRAAGDVVGFWAGVVEPLVVLRQAVSDHHLLIRGAGPELDADPRLVCREYQAIVSTDSPLPAPRRAGEGRVGSPPCHTVLEQPRPPSASARENLWRTPPASRSIHHTHVGLSYHRMRGTRASTRCGGMRDGTHGIDRFPTPRATPSSRASARPLRPHHAGRGQTG